MNTVQILRGLADTTRLSVVRELAKQPNEVACSEIVNSCALALKLSQPTMSHHFAKLVQSGVLSERKSGTEKYYSLNHASLETIGIDATKL